VFIVGQDLKPGFGRALASVSKKYKSRTSCVISDFFLILLTCECSLTLISELSKHHHATEPAESHDHRPSKRLKLTGPDTKLLEHIESYL
jgi:hypothetical protein